MANRLQLRKGTTAQNTAFKGANGELTYDTQTKQLRVHDGSTVGGKLILNPTDTTSAVTQATEALAGKAKIATTAIAQAGTNDTDFITPLKLRDALNADGNAPISACRAWAVINCRTTPPTIVESFNVASVSSSGAGRARVMFSVPMPTKNYAVLANGDEGTGSGSVKIEVPSLGNPPVYKEVDGIQLVSASASGAFSTTIYMGVFC